MFRVSGIEINDQRITLTGNSFYINDILSLTTGDTTKITNLVNMSGNFATVANLQSTGQTLIGLISAASAGVSTLNNASGIISLTGRGNVTVISGGVGLIQVSGDTGAYANFYPFNNPLNFATSGDIQTTGQTNYNLITAFSGVFNSSGAQIQNQINTLNSLSKVTSISVTGFPAQTGNINISGLGSITIFTGINNNILISGAAGGGGNPINSPLNTGSGTFQFIPKFTSNQSGIVNSIMSENATSGIVIPSGVIGALQFFENAGATTAFDLPVVSGNIASGAPQSYAFKINGVTLFKVYSEYDGASGIQNIKIIAGNTKSHRIDFIGGCSGTAPATNSLAVPITINIYGGTGFLMGNPTGWLDVLVSGVAQKIPYY